MKKVSIDRYKSKFKDYLKQDNIVMGEVRKYVADMHKKQLDTINFNDMHR